MIEVVVMLDAFLFFFKHKTAYEMRISDWSSDVCSSDLLSCRIAEPHHELRVRAIPDPARSGREREYIAARYAAAFRDHQQIGGRRGFSRLDEKIGRASCRDRVCQYV